MRSAFCWSMIVCGVAMFGLMALVPSESVTARPLRGVVLLDVPQEKQEQSWAIPARGLTGLRIKLQSGGLTIVAGTSDQVVVRATQSVWWPDGKAHQTPLKPIALTVEQRDGQVLINDTRSSSAIAHASRDQRVEVALELTVPAGMTLESSVGAGNTTVLGRVGKVELQTRVGYINLERQQGLSGRVAVGTGSVSLGGEVGDLAVQVNTGEVRTARVQAGGAEVLSIHNGTGNIWLSLDQLPKKQLEARTRTGDVIVRVPTRKGATDTKVVASTELGTSRVDYEATAEPRRTLRPAVP